MTTRPGAVPELLEGREVPLGGLRGMSVTRWLPHRSLPMVGAWCFVDRMGPQRVDMRVLPHPHTGLQTVTWPLEESIRHRDSLGSDVVLRPGELNLMTSGRGVAHSEVSLDDAPAGFEQHTHLPVVDLPGARVTVVVGELDGALSPATVHTPLLGADIALGAGAVAVVPLRASFEHAVLVLDGAATVAGRLIGVGPLLHLGAGSDELVLASTGGARLLLLGGEPCRDDLVMWWNFIGCSHEDVSAARAGWEAGDADRFGEVPGHGRERIPAPPLPAVRLTPRRRRPPLREVNDAAPAPAMS